MDDAILQTSAFIPITTTYASVLALIMLVLGVLVTVGRAKTDISLGDGGDPGMRKRMRAFGNFIEFVPMCVIIMLLVENASGRETVLHIMGIGLIVGRVAHAFGIHSDAAIPIARVAGALLTYLVLGLGALYALKLVLPGI